MSTLVECEPLRALNDALCHEEESSDFYHKAALRTDNPAGTEMFESLAAEAKTQADLLEQQIQSLTENNTWAILECALACEFDPNNITFPRDQTAFEKEIQPDASDLDAILFAMKAEQASFARYAQLAKVNTHEQARDFYTYLAEQTTRRIEILFKNYERASQGWI